MSSKNFTGWMFDMAREQSFHPAVFEDMIRRSKSAGYDALGLYFEHRFAYPSAPFAGARGALTPENARDLNTLALKEGIRLVPFLNTLGHMEGFIRAEGGQWLSEGAAPWSQQMCPSREDACSFAKGLVSDILDVFDDEWVHLGGDETFQLGQCPACADRVRLIGKAGLYAEYYGELCRWLIEKGRRPCLWGDMLLLHPEALDAIPKQTLIFDWQYFGRPVESSGFFRDRGFEVFCCPSLQSYNSVWCFWGESQRILDQHIEDAAEVGAQGVWLTTWESSYFTQYRSVMPLIYACGRRIARGESWEQALEAESSPTFREAAEQLGTTLPSLSPFLDVGTWRQLRDRFIIKQNPFYLWEDWREEACGEPGDKILSLCDQVQGSMDVDAILRFPIELHRVAVLWVRQIEKSYELYKADALSQCASLVRESLHILERLRPELVSCAEEGGSTGDVARLDRLVDKVRIAADRITALEPGASYKPSFETLIHDGQLTGDQAAWRTGFYR